jgi:hypothetical protein
MPASFTKIINKKLNPELVATFENVLRDSMKLAYLLESTQTQPEILASIRNTENILDGNLTQQRVLVETELLEKINIYQDVRSERILKC